MNDSYSAINAVTNDISDLVAGDSEFNELFDKAYEDLLDDVYVNINKNHGKSIYGCYGQYFEQKLKIFDQVENKIGNFLLLLKSNKRISSIEKKQISTVINDRNKLFTSTRQCFDYIKNEGFQADHFDEFEDELTKEDDDFKAFDDDDKPIIPTQDLCTRTDSPMNISESECSSSEANSIDNMQLERYNFKLPPVLRLKRNFHRFYECHPHFST